MDADNDGVVSQSEFTAWGRAQFGGGGGGGSAQDSLSHYTYTCPALVQLDGGCAHDLSLDDDSVAAGALVSAVCPEACSGHDSCIPPMLDISFLGATENAGSTDAAVDLRGGACVSEGGVEFGGDADGEVVLEGVQNYAMDGQFTVSMWLLKNEEDIWLDSDAFPTQSLYRHADADATDELGFRGYGALWEVSTRAICV